MQSDLLKAADEFGKSLQALVDTVEMDARIIVRKALFDLLCALMEGTPKDTVRCAVSWDLDTHWSEWQEPPGDYRGVDLLARAQQIIAALPDSDIFCLYNNIEYLMPLEDGHSTQAPSGFIATTMASFADYLSRAARDRGYSA